jgi:hypothetical protein
MTIPFYGLHGKEKEDILDYFKYVRLCNLHRWSL